MNFIPKPKQKKSPLKCAFAGCTKFLTESEAFYGDKCVEHTRNDRTIIHVLKPEQ